MVKQATKQRKSSPLLPIFGIVLALTFAVISYVFLPTVQSYLSRQGVLGTMDPLTTKLLIGGVMWALMFGASMFLVSLLVGRDYDESMNIKFHKEAAKRKQQQKIEQELRREHRRKMNRGG
jgi:uncharacterized membrane protein (DUF485 family)